MSFALFASRSDPNLLCGVIGLGLLGSRIAENLSKYCQTLEQDTRFDWHRPEQIAEHLQQILQRNPESELDIVWSAGKAGFAADDKQMAEEYEVFASIMQSLTQHRSRLRINFLSSAGGLYENSGRVNHIDDISPSRPYGHWKLKQEKLLDELGLPARKYRISSVYGPSGVNTRAGLINHLIRSARHGTTVTIYANQNTLRDYINSGDVARYIGQKILLRTDACLEILASGRATSIDTLIKMTGNITHWPVKATFISNNDNSNDIVFANHLLPKTLVTTSLEEGIRLLKHDRPDAPI